MDTADDILEDFAARILLEDSGYKRSKSSVNFNNGICKNNFAPSFIQRKILAFIPAQSNFDLLKAVIRRSGATDVMLVAADDREGNNVYEKLCEARILGHGKLLLRIVQDFGSVDGQTYMLETVSRFTRYLQEVYWICGPLSIPRQWKLEENAQHYGLALAANHKRLVANSVAILEQFVENLMGVSARSRIMLIGSSSPAIQDKSLEFKISAQDIVREINRGLLAQCKVLQRRVAERADIKYIDPVDLKESDFEPHRRSFAGSRMVLTGGGLSSIDGSS